VLESGAMASLGPFALAPHPPFDLSVAGAAGVPSTLRFDVREVIQSPERVAVA